MSDEGEVEELRDHVARLEGKIDDLEARYQAVVAKNGALQEIVLGDMYTTEDKVIEAPSLWAQVSDLRSGMTSHGERQTNTYTTQTENTALLGGQSRMRFNLAPTMNVTGFDAIGFDFSGSWSVADGETAEADLFVFSGGSGTITTTSVDGSENYTEYAAPVGEISATGAVNLELRLRSVGGTQVELRTPTVTMYGRIV